jgi:CheY-like chemotaxis protein
MSSSEKRIQGGPRFLIADDHAKFRRVVRDFLPSSGSILECSSGAMAVARFAEERPDCVLMDIEMEGINGITATRLIRQSFPAARIIVISQHADAESRAAAMEAGASAFVAKDELEALRPLLRTMLGEASRVVNP